MYALVGEFCISWNISTVPLTRFLCNAVFSRNQNARKSGNRWTLFLKYYSPMNKHGKTFVYDFCILWILLRVYLQDAKIIKESFVLSIHTAWPREIVVRGGHPLGLIEYVIERVYQVFLPFELHKFGICINPKECPPLTFHQPKDLNGVPSSHFHQPKGF